MDTGWKNPGTISTANNYQSSDWVDKDNAISSDGSYATFVMTDYSSDTLIATNFGFSIPAGSTIDGIAAIIEMKSDKEDSCFWQSAVLVKNGQVTGLSFGGSDDPDYPIYEIEQDYAAGGLSPSYVMGCTASDINNSGFGFGFIWGAYNSVSVTVSVDNMRMKIYYTEGSSSNTSSMLQMF